MLIFIFLVWKYPFCVNLVQKFKRAILRRNLPTVECLIDVPPLMNFSIFFTQDILFPPLPPPSPPPLWIIGESFHSEFETICWCSLFCDLIKGMTRLECVLFCKFVQRSQNQWRTQRGALVFLRSKMKIYNCVCSS